MSINRRTALTIVGGILFSGAVSFAQNLPTTTPPSNSNFPGFGRQTSGVRPYSEIITAKAKTDRGLFTTHKVEDKYYFEIPDSLLGREILVVNRIAKAPAGPRSGAGF